MNDRVGEAIDSVISNVQEAINRDLIGNPENPAEESLNAAFADFSDTLEQKLNQLGKNMTDAVNGQITQIIGDPDNPSEGSINYAINKIKEGTENAFDKHGKDMRSAVQTTLDDFVGKKKILRKGQ